MPADYSGNIASGIPNDYDGGLDFWPKQQQENEFITWHNAHLFLENENMIKPKGSAEAIEQFINVTQKIKEIQSESNTESNPVIVIVKLQPF